MRGGKMIGNAVLIIGLIIVLYPLLWTFFLSLRNTPEILSDPTGLPLSPNWGNYPEAFTRGDLGTGMMNSAIITLVSVGILCVIGPMVAYPLSKTIKGGKLIFYIFLAGMFIAPQVFIVPLYRFLIDLSLINTHLGLILVYTSGCLPYYVILLRGAFLGIPKRLEESAKIDGLSTFQTYRRVSLPLVKPAILTAAIIEGVWIWNDFFYPLILTRSRSMFTLPLALQVFRGGYLVKYGLVSASVIISILPMLILYLIFSDFIKKSVAARVTIKG